MVKVCARDFRGDVILIKECETLDEAEEFMKHDYVCGPTPDDIIYGDEMFIDNSDKVRRESYSDAFPAPWDDDELPF